MKLIKYHLDNLKTKKSKYDSSTKTISIRLLSMCFILSLNFSTFGQLKEKKSVTEKDYHLWGSLYFDKISEYGNWASYRMHYDEHPDTLFVRNTSSAKTFKIVTGSTGNFNQENTFAALVPSKGLEIIDLKNDNQKVIPEINSFDFSGNGKFLLTLRKSDGKKYLDIRDYKGNLVDSISGVNKYFFNPTKNKILCSSIEGENSRLLLISIEKTIAKQIIIESKKGIFTHMVWQPNGQSFAVLQHTVSGVKKQENNSIYYYRLPEKKMYYFDPESVSYISKEDRIADTYDSKLMISDDGSKIFFALIKKISTTQYDPDKVQVWNGNDKQLYPYRKEYLNNEVLSKLALWEPKLDRTLQIASDDRPFIVLSGDQRYAITYNSSELGLQYKEYPNSNFYITDLSSGTVKLWMENQNIHPGCMSMSPTGKYASYFREGKWWIYDFKNGTHHNITNGFKDLYDDEYTKDFPVGFEGWTANDKDILIRDKFDVWQVAVDQSKYKKLTNGREKNASTKVKVFGLEINRKINFDGYTGLTLDTEKLIFETTSKTDNNYLILNKKQKLNSITLDGSLVKNLNKAEKSNVYIYTTEDFNKPPCLIIKDINKSTRKVVVKSNPQHYNYLWGKSELIEYSNSKNKKNSAILYYPAGYNPAEKYPMIVKIYETWPDYLHRYYNPSLLLEIGFNISNLTSKGYFVLVPDIEYEIGNPGVSAADCVISSTKEIIKRQLINPERIALTGHSFGGYETNYIITQTNLFAAAVSGAGIGDFTSHYFSIGWNWGKAEIWRYESQQNRMGISFFQDKKGYDRNSPAQHADKVNTPILLWTGEEDHQIHYTQSIAFYLALQRNNKKQVMLIYPGDAHVIMDKNHQIDLTKRTEQWFDYYLKDKRDIDSDWIAKGIN